MIDADRTIRDLELQYAASRVLAEVTTVTEVCERLEWPCGACWLVMPDGASLSCVAFHRRAGVDVDEFERLTATLRFPRGVGLPGRVWATRLPVWLSSTPEETNFPRVKA